MKQLSILGSTGSIGTNVLKIVEMFPQRFAVKALTAKHNVVLLANQIERFHPEIAVVFDRERVIELKGILSPYNGTRKYSSVLMDTKRLQHMTTWTWS